MNLKICFLICMKLYKLDIYFIKTFNFDGWITNYIYSPRLITRSRSIKFFFKIIINELVMLHEYFSKSFLIIEELIFTHTYITSIMR